MSTDGFFTSRLEEAIGWARKYSIFQYPFVTACCGMEYMATACSHYDVDRFGAGLPRFSPRQADVLFVVGTISHKMAPVLKRIYDQMTEPKWVVAFGVCTCTGGFYDNYATVQGIDTIIPVDVYIPGCPPRPESVIDGLMKLQDKIAGQAQRYRARAHPRRAPAPVRRRRRRDARASRGSHRGRGARRAPRRAGALPRRRGLGLRRPHGPDGRGLPEVPRARGRPALRDRLPSLLDRPQPSAPAESARGRGGGAWPERRRALAHRQLARARGVGHVRGAVRGPPGSAPAPHVRRVRGPSAAQGLPDQPPPAADRAGELGTARWRRRRGASSCSARGAAPVAAPRTSTWAWGPPIPPCTGSSGSRPSSTARSSSTPTSRSGTCTGPSRRTVSKVAGTTRSRSPTGSTTCRRSSTTSATRRPSRSSWASTSPSGASTSASSCRRSRGSATTSRAWAPRPWSSAPSRY